MSSSPGGESGAGGPGGCLWSGPVCLRRRAKYFDPLVPETGWARAHRGAIMFYKHEVILPQACTVESLNINNNFPAFRSQTSVVEFYSKMDVQ